jgi:hypothetical protein
MIGNNSNWIEVLGSVAAKINSQNGRCKDYVSSFKAIYGQVLCHELSCSNDGSGPTIRTLKHTQKITFTLMMRMMMTIQMTVVTFPMDPCHLMRRKRCRIITSLNNSTISLPDVTSNRIEEATS